jgi:hypothetical protein
MAAYFLLDGDAGLRLAAAEGLLARTEAGTLDAASAGRIALLRSWLPADAARDTVDRVLRAAAERQAFGGAAPAAWKLAEVLGSISDGVGALSLAIGARRGRLRAIAMVLIKQGFGVKDAYIVECGSAAEQNRIMDNIDAEMDGVLVSVDHVAEMLAMALADGLEAGLPPAPGLIDVAEIVGLPELRPQPLATDKMIERFGVARWRPSRLEKAAAGSAFWVHEYAMVEYWFEDSSEVRAILEAHPDDEAAAPAIAAALEGRRDWWARICALTALTLKAAGDTSDASEFAGVAHWLASGAPLDELPIVETIVGGTLAARGAAAAANAGDRDDEDEAELDRPDGPHAPAPEQPGELGRLLARAGLTPMWLEGFAMAVAVAPKPIRPGDWVGEMIELAPRFGGLAPMQRLLDLLIARTDTATLATDDIAELEARIAAAGPEDLGEWARGFAHVARRFGAAWRDRSLNKDDKRVLALIQAVGEGEDAAKLRPIVVGWLARRRAMTR